MRQIGVIICRTGNEETRKRGSKGTRGQGNEETTGQGSGDQEAEGSERFEIIDGFAVLTFPGRPWPLLCCCPCID
jgi:hypothetical protein